MNKKTKKTITIIAILVGILILLNYAGYLNRPQAFAITQSCPSGTEYCSSITPNSRYVCNPTTGVVTKYYCPSGQICSSGSCVTIGGGTNCPSGASYCSSLSPTSTYSCNPTTGTVTKYQCSPNALGVQFVCSNGQCVCPSTGCGTSGGQCKTEGQTCEINGGVCCAGLQCANFGCVDTNKIKCGNGQCEYSETKTSCPQDCGTAPRCGDGVCDPGETLGATYQCLMDCHPIACSPGTQMCADGVCKASCTGGGGNKNTTYLILIIGSALLGFGLWRQYGKK